MKNRLANCIEPFLFESIENESIASNDAVSSLGNLLDETDNERQQHDEYTCGICDRNNNSMTANE